jgi:hypothetical protein
MNVCSSVRLCHASFVSTRRLTSSRSENNERVDSMTANRCSRLFTQRSSTETGRNPQMSTNERRCRFTGLRVTHRRTCRSLARLFNNDEDDDEPGNSVLILTDRDTNG